MTSVNVCNFPTLFSVSAKHISNCSTEDDIWQTLVQSHFIFFFRLPNPSVPGPDEQTIFQQTDIWQTQVAWEGQIVKIFTLTSILVTLSNGEAQWPVCNFILDGQKTVTLLLTMFYLKFKTNPSLLALCPIIFSKTNLGHSLSTYNCKVYIFTPRMVIRLSDFFYLINTVTTLQQKIVHVFISQHKYVPNLPNTIV